MPVSRSVGLLALAAFFLLLGGLPLLTARAMRKASRCSTRSIGPARWCSAEGMSFCRCSRGDRDAGMGQR